MAGYSPQNEVQRLQNRIDIETKIKDGAENLLSLFDTRPGSSSKQELRKQIELELDAANTKISALVGELQRYKHFQRTTSPAASSNTNTDYQSNPDSWSNPDLSSNTVSRLEQSALGLDATPSQHRSSPAAQADTPHYSVLPAHFASHNGSPPSTNYVNELSSGVDPTEMGIPSFGGLGLGLDAGHPTAVPAWRPGVVPSLVFGRGGGGAASEAPQHHDLDASDPPATWERENEDARASRSQAISLVRMLRTASPRPPLTSPLPTLSEDTTAAGDVSSATIGTLDPDATLNETTTGLSQNPENTRESPLRAPVVLPRIPRQRRPGARNPGLAASTSHARTPSNATGLADETKRQIDHMNHLVDILKHHARVRYELPLDELVDAVMPRLCDQAGKEVRATAYRLIRHALVQPLWPLVSRCRSMGLDIYLARTLTRDNRFELEKIQAIKLIRAIMELSALRSVNTAPDRLALELDSLLGTGVVRALAAVAEHGEDKLRHLCLETLTELAIFDVRLLINGGGLRSTLQALTEGPIDFAPTLVQSFLYLVDMPGTRQHLRPGVDLEIAMSGLTEAPAMKPVTYDALLRSSARVVSVMLRSWQGLIYMCMDDKRAVRSLVQALRVNPLEVKDVLLDMLYDLFNVRGASGTIDPASKRESSQKAPGSPSLAPPHHGGGGAFSSMSSTAAEAASSSTAKPVGDLGDQPRSKLNLVDHYLALLLVVFTDAGLVDALVDVIEHAPDMARKATLLTGELLQVSKRVHPPSRRNSIHFLPHLFSLAANFRLDKSDERQAAASALSFIDHVNRQRAHHEAIVSAAALSGTVQSTTRDRSNSVEESMRRGQRQVEKTKLRIGMQIDDVHFRALMMDTQLLNTKEHAKWNLDAITDLLEGPLLNARRVDEAAKGTKLLKRLLAFYHPFALRFSALRRTPLSRRYVRLACLLLTTLISTPEGIRALSEDRLLRELHDCLDQLNPISANPVSDPLLSRKRMQDTLCLGYFEMLGVLTTSVEGIRLLERFKIFTPLYRLSELRSRDDILKAVIENVDYTIEGHPRIVLSKALTSNYRDVRLFATKHLEELIRQTVSPSGAGHKTQTADSSSRVDWAIGLLLNQLYDPAVEVRQTAVRVLGDVCNSIQLLEKVVSMRPTLDHLGELGNPLLLKFLSTSVGVRYLWQLDYVDREMEEWFNERNHRYTVQVEVMLADFFSIYRKQGGSGGASASASATEWSGGTDRLRTGESSTTPSGAPYVGAADTGHHEGSIPPHFYGELAKTAEGCQMLEDKGHFAEFAHFIRQHGTESSDAELISKLKSVLWAVGNIGSTELGLPFLEAEDVVARIVEIAEGSLVLSVRGTCFYVLGLISSTHNGAELLKTLGWQSVRTPLGVSIGLCVPDDVQRLLTIPRWTAAGITSLSHLELADPETVVVNKVITSIANLGNSILATNASRSLTKLKAKHRAVFQDMSVLARALQLMDTHYYRLPVRRYIWELFDVALDQDSVGAIQRSTEKLIQTKRAQLQRRGKSRNGSSAD
ncbi:hypothetical protein BCV70DRAFT_178261, partial [Testicularia cyperi]